MGSLSETTTTTSTKAPLSRKRLVLGLILVAILIIGLPLLLTGIAGSSRIANDTRAVVTLLKSSKYADESLLVIDEAMRHELEPLVDDDIAIFDADFNSTPKKFWVFFWRRQDAATPEDYGINNQNYRLISDFADGRYLAFELEKTTP